ncbi:hypothetical protein ZYGNAAKF_CDS0041 [Enterococcus phage VRE9_2]
MKRKITKKEFVSEYLARNPGQMKNALIAWEQIKIKQNKKSSK